MTNAERRKGERRKVKKCAHANAYSTVQCSCVCERRCAREHLPDHRFHVRAPSGPRALITAYNRLCTYKPPSRVQALTSSTCERMQAPNSTTIALRVRAPISTAVSRASDVGGNAMRVNREPEVGSASVWGLRRGGGARRVDPRDLTRSREKARQLKS